MLVDQKWESEKCTHLINNPKFAGQLSLSGSYLKSSKVKLIQYNNDLKIRVVLPNEYYFVLK